MALPWFKMPTDEDFCLHAIGPTNESYYNALLRIKGRGQLDQSLNHIHIPQFHAKLTSWIGKLIGINKQRAAKLKETLLVHGLINEYWQPMDWEQRYGPGAHRRSEASTDEADTADKPAPLTKEEKEERERERKRVNQRRYRANLASKAQAVTGRVTTTLPSVTKSPVTRPENSSRNSFENQQVTRCVTETLLDVRALDLDSKSLKAKATRETTTQAPPSTPEVDVTYVTGKAKATATATATATAKECEFRFNYGAPKQ